MATQKYFPGSIPSGTDSDNDYAAAAASESDDSNCVCVYVTEYLFVFVVSVHGLFVFSLYVSAGLIRGGHVTHNFLFSFATRTRVLKSACGLLSWVAKPAPHGYVFAPPWVGSRSPDGWNQIPRWAGGWACTSHPGVLGSIPKRDEPGKTGRHPVLKYRVPNGSQDSWRLKHLRYGST